MKASQFQDSPLAPGETTTTAQTVAHLLQLGTGPGALQAAIRADEVLEVCAHHQTASSALGTTELRMGLEIGGETHVGTGKVMDEPFVGN